ncbi:LytR C-terminal domain-containing protein [Boudabousia tangfeifanii]|uniref:LytR C-terminal domain-containing protein n=1 Tax=Boudabousia tangfeifanii TaxID=1912795 RepID=UPI0014795527|nr:LytR C-terminal domain-containing protein [Boudabousia tangfeifanii]
MSGKQNPRALYRSALEKKRTTTFLVLFGWLAVVLVVGFLFATGAIKAPYDPPFSHGAIKPTYYTTPCLADDAKPVSPNQVKVRVLNATDQRGLATKVGDALTAGGFVVTKVGNAAAEVEGAADIRTSIYSISEAYELQRMVPDAAITLMPGGSPNNTELELLLGNAFNQVVTPEGASDLSQQRQAGEAANCKPVDPLFIKESKEESGADEATMEGPAPAEGTPAPAAK